MLRLLPAGALAVTFVTTAAVRTATFSRHRDPRGVGLHEGGQMPGASATARWTALAGLLTLTALWMALVGARPTASPPLASSTTPTSSPASERQGPARRVLLLYTEPRLTPAVVAADDRLRSVLETRSPARVTFHTEFLDLDMFDDAVPQPELRELLRRKYATRPIDLIVAAGSRALRVALQNRADLFTRAPVVFLAVDPTAAADIRLETDVTGTWLHQGWAETLDLAHRLQPEIRRAIVINGTSPADRVWLAQARGQLGSRHGAIEVTYLTDRRFEDVLKEVAALPAGSVVLHGSFLRDGEGRDLTTREAAKRVAAAASVPVYAVAESAVGTGIVGGQVVSFEAHGQAAAELALRVLSGERPPSTDAGTTFPTVDARQVERWGLDARRLPVGTVVRFREPSLWEQHRTAALAILAVLVVQGLVIGGLLLERGRRRRAEQSLRRLSGRLLTAHEEERRRIARDLHDDVGQRLSLLAIEAQQLQTHPRGGPGGADGRPRELATKAQELASVIQQIAYELHPAQLEHLGFPAALRRFAEELRNRHGLVVEVVETDWPRHVSPDTALCLYRVTQEALRNVVRHSGVREARVTLEVQADGLTVTIADGGVGFDPGTRRAAQGLGLTGMQERLRLVGGTLAIDTTAGRGTRIQARVPHGLPAPSARETEPGSEDVQAPNPAG
jgi:signal transduction histidine kinase